MINKFINWINIQRIKISLKINIVLEIALCMPIYNLQFL